ncbi:peptidase, M48 family [Campylobacter iguaniorum]|uniref:M48 family metallopeptidase n=1 Tax=Campylobacter iguaniorum TaxID=1244531 RepID=UPI00073A1CF7|nr:M48 family metallopeptidase [Campylobacter iguaniorum]ALV23777.1 peptidase, M48 family [Campylobacter iguaniorum]
MKVKFIIFSMVLASLLVGCISSSTNQTAVVDDRKQLFLVSSAQMDESANLAYAQTISKAKSTKTLNVDAVQTKRVKAISSRLIKEVGVFRKDALNWDWQVNVIDEETINAWCMPGGKIVVYSGIIKSLNLNDDELAAIVAHEISHALREHSREKASVDMAKNLAIGLGGKLLGLDENAQSLADLASKYTLTLPFSRSNETEADTMGLELMARAGFDPKATVNVWKKMSKLNSSAPLEMLSTHPSNQSRIENLQNLSKKVEPLYK